MGSLAESAAFCRDNPYFCYDPHRGMVAFHESPSARRFVRAPTQSGKTWAGIYEDWSHLVGRHRWRRVEPSSGWVVLANLENHYSEFCTKLRALEPRALLDPATRYVEGSGYYTNGRRMVRSRGGQTMSFRSGEGSMQALESGTIGWLHIDEVPKQPHFGAAMSRIAVREAPVWMTFTPIGRPCGWLREHVEGNPETGAPPREAWEQFRPRLTEADCTTVTGRVVRSAASIEAQCASYSAWEYEQRVNGGWEGVSTGRRLSAFSEACYLGDDEEVRVGESDEVRVGIDHGEGAGKEVAHVGVVSGRRYLLLGEYVGKATSTPREHADGILAVLASLGLSVYDVSRWFGDTNSAGLIGAGSKYNSFLEYAFADALGVATCPFAIESPPKGRGSVNAGEAAINHACKEGRWRVSSSCVAFSHSARHYTGREKDLKDPLDSARYAFLDRLLRDREATSRATLVR